MGNQVEFRLLGPVGAWREGERMPAGTPQQRLVLGLLALRAGSVVSGEDLVTAIWGADPPRSARNSIQVLVTRLRQVLAGTPDAVLARCGDGYRLDADRDRVDVHRFRRLTAQARQAADRRLAVAEFDEALSLWRGPALADAAATLRVEQIRSGLEEERLDAAEDRFAALLGCGRHQDAAAGLAAALAEHPLRERLAWLLMLAAYRCGRKADALAVFRQTRARLAADLGVEPGPELQQLHQRILACDPELDAPPQHYEAAAAGSPDPDDRRAARPAVPRQLPAATTHFVGRDAELDTLTRLLADHARDNTTAVISAIVGTAGVGKTALAVHWAHRVADRFPDGQLYVDLRGYDPDRPVAATDALAGFLRALGVPGQDIPVEEAERAARYRSLLAGRRVLVLLDNAGEVEQVRPLLPGSPACAAIVTSRDSLAGLVARDGAERIELDLLRLEDAVSLLRALIGRRVAANPDAARALAVRCCRLPLALRVTAELAASRPDAPLGELAGELAGQQGQLDLLEAAGDRRTAVRAVFSWSYAHLDADAARMFRLLGLHPGPGFESRAAAALSGTTVEQARQVLDVLARAHLILPASPGRYGLHDLLRAYARERAESSAGEDGRRSALTGLFDYYLHAAAVAMDVLYPAGRHRRPRISPSATPAPPITTPATARAWLDAERVSLVATAVHTADHGWATHATRLATTLFYYLDIGGHYPEAVTVHTYARAAARRAGDRAAEATALNHLASVHWHQARYQQAARHLRQAMALFGQAADHVGQAHVLKNLGLVEQRLGHYGTAARFHQQALAIFREIPDRAGEASALNDVGTVEELQGHYDLAARHHEQALAIASETRAQLLQCVALVNLGTVGLRQGRYQQAAGHLDRALTLCREYGYREAEADALTRIGDICLRQGRVQDAVGHLQEALALYRSIGERSGEASATNSLGEVLLATGRPGDARIQHGAALDLASAIGHGYEQARAHTGLGRVCQDTGDLVQARHHWQEALTRYAKLGVPEADQVRAQLSASGPSTANGHKGVT
jgi:DNA-binding SARP family transcriptional activator/Tfp pilus assembly protein PilF